MQRVGLILGVTCAVSIACSVIGQPWLSAHQPSIKRTIVLQTAIAGQKVPMWVMGQDDTVVRVATTQEAHMWIAELAPGAATGKHAHVTPRFIYVLEGAVTLDIEGQAPQTFKAGEGFQETPEVVHDVRNASTTAPAKALGFLIAGQGQPILY